MPQVDIVLADDHDLVRRGARAVLESDPGFRVVGEAATGLEVMPLVEKLKPGVLVIDLLLPGLNGLDVARTVASAAPLTRMVMLSVSSDAANVARAFRCGVLGYVLKASNGADLVLAVREALVGRTYLSPGLSGTALAGTLGAKAPVEDPYEALSSRERQVLQLVAEGLSNGQIGDRLGIGVRTVETHRANLMRKLSLKGSTSLVRYAQKRGLLADS